MISTTRSFSPAACLLVAAVTGSAMGDVITVDDDDPGADFATIQEAVDAAVDGDRIEVWPGYYFGDLQTPDPVVKVDGKSIEIVAVNLDPTLTVIAGQGHDAASNGRTPRATASSSASPWTRDTPPRAGADC